MADEIKLKAPTVEQQVVVNINGEEKLRSFADTLDKISNNKNLQKYWKTQQELINATANAYGNFQKKASKDNATELIKVTNALKAMSGTDLSNILPDFDKISKAMAEAQKVVGNIDSAFSVKGFKEAFDSFETLKAYSEDIEKIFSHFGVSSDVGELQNNVRALEGEVEKLTRRLANAKNANEELRNEFNNFKSGSGFADKLDELDNLKSEMSYIREEAEETFRQFLKLNNVSEDGYDRDGFYDDNRFREYFQNIQSGYMSASDAIRQFKTEYSYLLEESFKTNNDTFGLEQLQAFSNKLDYIFRQVEETSTKINDIISNGVITKSVENLSIDSSLSDSQRSLFGNLLQDEESLKSITALFQKLIEESNKTSKVDLFNDEQLQQVLSIFDKMEGHLSSLRSIISDVGDGEEFSPLLKILNSVNNTLLDLKTTIGSLDDGKIRSVAQNLQLINKKVGKSQFNVNIKEDNSLDAMQQQEKANQFLEKQYNTWIKRYESILSIFNKNNIDPFTGLISDSEIGQMYNYDADALRKLYGKESISGLDNFREKIERITEALRLFRTMATNNLGVDDSLFNELNKLFSKSIPKNISTEYLNEKLREIYDIKRTSSSSEEKAENLLNQINSHNDKINKIDEKNKVNDLQAVLDVLNNINKTLTELVASATTFSEKFKEGFNVTASVEEIDKLTNRVKELEDELSKIKLNPVNVDKSNISSGTQIKDVFQGDDKVNTDASTTAIKEESQALEQVSTSAKEAATSKEKFANANKEVKASAESSSTSLEEEKKKFENVGDSAEETKKKLDDVIFKPNTEGFDEIVSKLDIAKDKIEEISKITKSSVWSESQGEYLESYNIKYKNGTSEIRGESSNKKGSNVLRANEVAYDAKAEEQVTKARLNSEQKVQAQKDAFHKKNLTAIDLEIQKREEESKMVSSVLKTQMEERQKQLSSMESSLKLYQDKAFDLSIKPDGANRFPEYQAQLDSINKAINDYSIHINSLQNKGVIDPSDIDEANRLKSIIEELLKNTKKFSSGDKGFTNIGADKVLEKINSILEQNSRMSKTAKDQIKAYYNEIYSGNPTRPLNEILDSVYKIVQQEREAGRAGKSWLEVFKDKKIYSFIGQAASMFSFYDLVNVGREGFQTIRELDTALTEMKKVSDETTQSLKKYQSTTFDTADAIGTTAKQIQASTADYMRLGETIDDAAESARTANILLNVSEFESIEDATKSLVSMGQAYKDLDKIEIVDKLNEVGNNYAISTDELATALQKSAATLSLMGNTIDEAAALVTTANSVIQDADSVSAGIRTISLRLVGTEEAEEELSAMNEEVDAFVKATNSKKQQIIKDYTAVASNNYKGFDILDDNGNYKNTYEILLGISKVYKEIQEQDKKLGTNHATALIEELAGKNRSNIASAILQDPTQLEAVKKSSEEALGSAQKELDSYLDSIDGRHFAMLYRNM